MNPSRLQWFPALFLEERSLKPSCFSNTMKSEGRSYEKCKFVAVFHEVDHLKNYSLSLHLGSSLSKKTHFLEGNRFSGALALAPPFLRSIRSLSCHSFLDVPPAPSSWALSDAKMASHCICLHKGGWHPAI